MPCAASTKSLVLTSSRASLAYYADQLRDLGAALGEAFGTAPSREGLLEAAPTMNRTRMLLQRLYEQRKGECPAIDGTESLRLVMAATKSPKAKFNRWLEGYSAAPARLAP